MTIKTFPFGVVGLALALAGLVGFSLAPDALWVVTLAEGLALVCLVAFLVREVKNLFRSSLDPHGCQ